VNHDNSYLTKDKPDFICKLGREKLAKTFKEKGK